MSSRFNKGKPVGGGGQRTNRPGLGPSGMCKCTKCGYSTPHQRGTPCTERPCPKCGSMMYRE